MQATKPSVKAEGLFVFCIGENFSAFRTGQRGRRCREVVAAGRAAADVQCSQANGVPETNTQRKQRGNPHRYLKRPDAQVRFRDRHREIEVPRPPEQTISSRAKLQIPIKVRRRCVADKTCRTGIERSSEPGWCHESNTREHECNPHGQQNGSTRERDATLAKQSKSAMGGIGHG
jgi:hypothetical protein